MKTRVRFAPSPTGPLHIGGLRTALFSYLYAKQNQGDFILRIEDTDQNRYIEGSEKYIQDALEWCGIIPNEGPKYGGSFGPYRQSDRKNIYQEQIQKLIDKGRAYYAFDSSESLSKAREEAESKGETFRYGHKNRLQFKNSLTLKNEKLNEALKGKYVVRLKVRPGEKVTVLDLIRGNVQVNTDELDDKILIKSDGMPTYHFANVVDDELMEISCVIRGEEWLPSLPLHQLLYDAFEWDAPQFMHLPLILKPNGKGKLSKRDGDKGGFPVFPLKWGEDTKGFFEMGFLKEGMINYLALLGWNSGDDEELYSMNDLIRHFSIDGIQKGGARFDYEKARWVNHQHILGKTSEELYQLEIIKKQLIGFSKEEHIAILELVKERLYTLLDLEDEVKFLKATYPYEEKSINKILKGNPIAIGMQINKFLSGGLKGEKLKNGLKNWANENNIPMGSVMQTFRLALVGKLTGPDLFDICKILGKEVSLDRVNTFIDHINHLTKN
ncbi:MAG: glutamate--tRNA ligase [Flavobacteriaceae bacterium]